MRIEDFDYFLPKEMIAQHPSEERASSRLLVFNRRTGTVDHRRFGDLTDYLREGDILVLNNSKVFPARLIGKKETGGIVDILLVRKSGRDTWECLVKNAKKGADISSISIGDYGATLQRTGSNWQIRFLYDGDSEEIIDKYGKMPLPPYIKRNNGDGVADYKRYQTVYAKQTGSIAAPTAGFHFTETLISSIRGLGVDVVEITLHIGLGTFTLIKSENVEEHTMHQECYQLSEAVKELISSARSNGRRVIACGTSAVRTLETAFSPDRGSALQGETDLFIYPGHTFRVVDAVITNFHLPRSTPLLLAGAFAGREALMQCYEEAKREGYRFYSYGDSMLLL